jgi:hypothetical protein
MLLPALFFGDDQIVPVRAAKDEFEIVLRLILRPGCGLWSFGENLFVRFIQIVGTSAYEHVRAFVLKVSPLGI